MRLPKSIKGYISLFNQMTRTFIPSDLKGFEDLPDEIKDAIKTFDCDISNIFGEIEDMYLKHLNDKK